MGLSIGRPGCRTISGARADITDGTTGRCLCGDGNDRQTRRHRRVNFKWVTFGGATAPSASLPGRTGGDKIDRDPAGIRQWCRGHGGDDGLRRPRRRFRPAPTRYKRNVSMCPLDRARIARAQRFVSSVIGRRRPETGAQPSQTILASMPTIDLRQGSIVRLPEGPGTTVTACAGAVWITEQDSPRDVVLSPGQSFTLARPGLALVQAFRDASILVDRVLDAR